MKNLQLYSCVGLALAGLASWQALEPEPGEAERLQRGEYLAHHVASCVECHTPRDEQGALQMSRQFQGARIPVGAPGFAAQWALRAPDIAGLSGRSAERALQVLMGALPETESPPRPPMPAFRLSRADAEAVIAYLASLE